MYALLLLILQTANGAKASKKRSVAMMKIIVAYHTFSGNTEEVAEILKSCFRQEGFNVTMYRIGSGETPELHSCDFLLLGTFTWEEGAVPEEVQDYIDFNYIPSNIAIFGTGDTQFGGEVLFCRAVDSVAHKVSSPYIPLKVEQSPRGSQTPKVERWARQLIKAIKKKGKM